jgi:hypothetical protein
VDVFACYKIQTVSCFLLLEELHKSFQQISSDIKRFFSHKYYTLSKAIKISELAKFLETFRGNPLKSQSSFTVQI